jgi:hypothetical protein
MRDILRSAIYLGNQEVYIQSVQICSHDAPGSWQQADPISRGRMKIPTFAFVVLPYKRLGNQPSLAINRELIPSSVARCHASRVGAESRAIIGVCP